MTRRIRYGLIVGDLLLCIVFLSSGPFACSENSGPAGPRFSYDEGGIVRGDERKRELALVFTGDEYADGGEHIRAALTRHRITATFFFTGRFYRNPAFSALIEGLKEDGHYLGAHSDQHLLYCSWDDRDRLLVTRDSLIADLDANYNAMERFGIAKSEALHFMPPYEWYNESISAWVAEHGLILVNFTPGTRSAADYTTPEMGDRYVSSDAIFQSILAREEEDPNGLNGFILLLHIGTAPERSDKFYQRLDELIAVLKGRAYRFSRIDDLLEL